MSCSPLPDQDEKMARKDDTVIKVVLLALVVALIFYMVVSFQGVEFSVVGIQGQNTVRAGEEQSYHLQLQTVNPDQFKTATHYREQFGQWRIQDADGNIISPGKSTKIENGAYDQIITINIPFDYKYMVLIAEIIEYQYSTAEAGGTFLKDEGTVREKQVFEITVQQCVDHTECNAATCLGQFGYCNEGTCEIKGDCHECVANADCSSNEEADPAKQYQCQDFKCFEYIEPTAIDQFKEAFREPITEPGTVTSGEIPKPKEAPQILSTIVFGMFIVLIYLVVKKRGK